MADFYTNYLKYKTKYLKLKKSIEGGNPPKVENQDNGSEAKPSKSSIQNLEAEFLRRDDQVLTHLSNVMEQLNAIREQITQNREFMLSELATLQNSEPVLQVLSVAPVPKMNVFSQQQISAISSQLNAILTDKTLEGSDKKGEKIDRLDAVYTANMELCDTSDDKGLVTLLLRYACLKHDDQLITKLIPRLNMTRDYLLLMSFYVDKREENMQLFREKINLDKIDQKNIDFIKDNGLSYLLVLLEGRFIKSSEREGLVDGTTLPGLRQFYIPSAEYYIDKICNYKMEVGEGKQKDKLLVVECTSSQKKDRMKMQNLLETDPSYNNYDVIIDGGNLMHVGGGKNVRNIVNAFLELNRQGLRPLVVLYHKHTKDSSIVAELTKNNITYIATPGSNDDDIFTLLAFLNNSKKQRRCHILTNDKYKKWFAVYKHTDDGQEKNLEGFISDVLLEYNIAPNGSVNILTRMLPYSQCIQVVDKTVYFPTETHGMVKPFVL